MTASAIQGDMEKCKKAGMDDYMAKPVKSKLLEGMLVRWSLQKRSAPTPQPSSEASECSHESDHCTNSGIPCVGLEDSSEPGGHDVGQSVQHLHPVQHHGSRPSLSRSQGAEAGDSGSIILTPRPKASPLAASPSPASPQQAPPVRRLESDELAQQGRDDKLIDAAGQPQPGLVPTLHTPLSEKGDSLTEANVLKFEREEELRRRKMS